MLGIWSGVITAVVAFLAEAPAPAVWGGVVLLTVAFATGRAPWWLEPVYLAWNRLARLFARAAGLWFTAICFFVVTAAGLGGSRLRRSGRTGESGWKPHARMSAGAFRSSSRADGTGDPDGGWLAAVAAWSRESHSPWVLALVPFLLGLRLVRRSGTSSLDANIYTLY